MKNEHWLPVFTDKTIGEMCDHRHLLLADAIFMFSPIGGSDMKTFFLATGFAAMMFVGYASLGLSSGAIGRYEILIGEDELFYFEMKTAGGEIIARSPGYETRHGVIKGIVKLQQNAASNQIVDLAQEN